MMPKICGRCGQETNNSAGAARLGNTLPLGAGRRRLQLGFAARRYLLVNPGLAFKLASVPKFAVGSSGAQCFEAI